MTHYPHFPGQTIRVNGYGMFTSFAAALCYAIESGRFGARITIGGVHVATVL